MVVFKTENSILYFCCVRYVHRESQESADISMIGTYNILKMQIQITCVFSDKQKKQNKHWMLTYPQKYFQLYLVPTCILGYFFLRSNLSLHTHTHTLLTNIFLKMHFSNYLSEQIICNNLI